VANQRNIAVGKFNVPDAETDYSDLEGEYEVNA